MSEEEAKQEDCPSGAPAWVMTFADLMSLLMCFFVLLLSFSEMDVQKFKQIAGSMKYAFGVQRTIEAKDIPKGTSVIAQEFSPGKPTPTTLQVVQQETTDDTRDNVEMMEATSKKIQEMAETLREELKDEVDQGLLEVDTEANEVMIRIREKGSFPSGSAVINKSFLPILRRIAEVLKKTDGEIVVAGHTDNIPISTPTYPSNWVLSAARAANVVHYFSKIDPELSKRMQIRAYADTRPKAPNDTPENRARNRRVEIIIREGSQQPIEVEDPENILEIQQ
ncbi:MAG: type VI secretion system protein TssL [Gammaproteobacteria bacterium]|nr:MAG: type VI secretion system protein TssL [Gammaproteobacteria bacterium]